MTAPHRFKPALRAATLALTTAALMSTGAPSLAAGTHLCDGYRSCAAQGMGSGGYAAVNGRSYWRMYSGHNCTNYAAYRMIKSGMPNVRPWSGGGNATYWGRYMSRYTDQTPRVGAIAWWQDGGPGHVAYVERVVSSSEIIISQDSWGGDFSWARVTKAYRWPDGFIHFNDQSLDNVVAPKFSGRAKVGSDVRTSTGTWEPSPTSVSYRWYVGDRLLPRAKTRTVHLTSWMVGKPLRVRLTAQRYGYPDRTITRTAGEILPGTITTPTPPRFGGRAQVDREVRVSAGTWSPAPVAVTYQWLVEGTKVKGATSPRFDLAPRHAGKSLAVKVTGRRPGYAAVTRTLTAGEVALGSMEAVRASQVEGGSLRGDTLRLRAGTTSVRSHRSVQWLRDGEPIAGATDATYTLRRRDVSHQVSVRVTHTRNGYRTVLEQVGSRQVKGKVRLASERTRVRRGFVFDLRPTVAGRPLPDGTRIWVGNRGHNLDRGVLHDGHLRLRVTGLPRGYRTLWFHVAPTDSSIAKVVARRPFFR